MSNIHLIYLTPSITQAPSVMLLPNNPKTSYAEQNFDPPMNSPSTNSVGCNIALNFRSLVQSSESNSVSERNLCSRSSDSTSLRTDESNLAIGTTSLQVCPSTSNDSRVSDIEHGRYFNQSSYFPLLANTTEYNNLLILPASSDQKINSATEHGLCSSSSIESSSLRTDESNHAIATTASQMCSSTSNDLKTGAVTVLNSLPEPDIDVSCVRVPKSNTVETAAEYTLLNSPNITYLLQSQVPSPISQKSQTKEDNSEMVILIPLDTYNSIKQGKIAVKEGDVLSNIVTQKLGSSAPRVQKNLNCKIDSNKLKTDVKTDDLRNPSQKQPTMAELLRPLYKYIEGNKCLLCGFESKSSATYRVRRHLATHLHDRNFKCDECEKSFASSKNLAIHKLVHTSECTFICNECDEKCLTKAAFFRHKQKHKFARTHYCCTVCSTEFSNASSLKNHLRVHTGEKPYMCSVCKETFRTRGMLKNHALHHNPEKLHCCTICNKRYKSRALLVVHMHSHQSPAYMCEVCGKKFNFRSNLAQHMRVHSDTRRHACETCGMKFKFSHHLRSHLVTHNK